jgi:Kef-type K+ transport system membrane component KefB
VSNHAAGDLAAVAIGDIALILVIGALFAMLARRVKQPAVIGEIVAGICLGPSLLGLLPGDLPNRIFPPEVRPHLNLVAQIGLLLFMFTIGWEFDRRVLSGRRRSTGIIWVCSIALPLTLGMSLAVLLHRSHGTVDGEEVPLLHFAFYIGIAMSIAAFPVLARIITDKRLQFSRPGSLALALAAADDVLAWCLLAAVVGMVTASGSAGYVTMVIWSMVYIIAMFCVVRPVLAAVVQRMRRRGTPLGSSYVLIAFGALGSAYVSSEIGIHAIFGAFLFGLMMPRDPELRRTALPPIEHVGTLLLPVFFVVTGLSVDLTALTMSSFLQMLAIIAVACFGKLGGVAIPARLTGMSWRDATTLGLLMNTRGLTELVILNVGLQLGLLTIELFTAMVMMALVTTTMAAPLLSMIIRDPAEPRSPLTARRLRRAAATPTAEPEHAAQP